ncbi:MAG TPA: hypothetical protein VGR28_03980 [Candidatus Thermoplasmatota archaeon]|jgi:hypothetical protein|nr:hypothetical protein [Candidatus Thermoplasmatota archaeon]
MRAPLLALLLASLALVVAGCVGSPQPGPSEPESPTADLAPPVADVAAPESEQLKVGIVVLPFEGKLTVAAGAQGVGYVTPTGNSDAHAFSFPVEEGATAIIAELAWADTTQDLDLELGTPDCDTTAGEGVCAFADAGQAGAGDSPIKLVFTDPEVLQNVGDWKLLVWGKNAVNAEFRGAITVFYNMLPQDDYTAL